MTDQRVVDRALTLAEMAPNDSVTMAVLAGREGPHSKAAPLNEPPVTYLEGAEAPAYILSNVKRGIGLGSKRNTVSPQGDRQALVLVTGRRTLCLVGRESEDERIEIPHEAVAEVTYKTGFRAHRLTLTTPHKEYHCWVHRKTEETLLEQAWTFIEDRKQETPSAIDDEDGANRVMYRGRPVKTDAETNGNGDATADGSDDEDATSETSDSEEYTVMYRGRPVDRSS
ncbi:hypothetical protein [Haloarcula marina]|uniref:hypothetical protein n=1 Tax=Haloarcula marina TaxID=2961574 RepID=UPI0020B7916D|nr:hypothetical protein [Halomicroarcula marina]